MALEAPERKSFGSRSEFSGLKYAFLLRWNAKGTQTDPFAFPLRSQIERRNW